MDMKEFVIKLGINLEGRMDGDKYIIELSDSNEYSRMYTLLDSSDLVEIEEDATLLTDKVGELLFTDDTFDIKLVGNFASDIYRLVVTERE
jgi:hypothetical protein